MYNIRIYIHTYIIHSYTSSDSEYVSAAAIGSTGRSADLYELVQEALVVTGLAQLRVCVCTRTVRATSQLCRGAALLLQYVYDCVYMSILVCVYMTIYVTKYVYAICSCLIILLYVCSTYSGNTYINLSHIHLPVISYLTHLPRQNW
jgi:hypothetical protein